VRECELTQGAEATLVLERMYGVLGGGFQGEVGAFLGRKRMDGDQLRE
jgi:hypothetical protein